jgi:ATP-dependent Clp protease protease subunit
MVTPGARILIHQPSLGDVIQGDVSDLEIQANELLRTREQLETLLTRHTGQDLGRIRTDIERDKVFDAQAAVDYGLVDRLTTSRKANPAPYGLR